MAAWQLNGNVLIACNCDWGCPCNFNARPVAATAKVAGSGSSARHIGSVSLDGLGLALFADWPRAIHEGGGRASVTRRAR